MSKWYASRWVRPWWTCIKGLSELVLGAWCELYGAGVSARGRWRLVSHCTAESHPPSSLLFICLASVNTTGNRRPSEAMVSLKAFQIKPVAWLCCSRTEERLHSFVEGAGYNPSIVVLPSLRRGYLALSQIVPCYMWWGRVLQVSNQLPWLGDRGNVRPLFGPGEMTTFGFVFFCAIGVLLELPNA